MGAGVVEPVEPPPAPYHVLAQQVLARVLQEGGAPRDRIAPELAPFFRTAGIAPAELEAIVAYMLEEGILFEEGGILGLGEEGRALYGARNYLELFSVFLSPPLFTVLYGNAGLGQVHELTFRGRAEGPVHLSLGGRTWRVRHVDWSARRAYMEPGDLPRRSRWLGSGQPMRFELARAVREVLLRGVEERFLSRRAGEKLEELREEHAWLSDAATTLRVGEPEGESRWWRFAGDLYNAAAAAELTRRGLPAASDALAVSLRSDAATLPETVADAARVVAADPLRLPAPADDLHLKFIECVPPSLRAATTARRSAPGDAAVRAGAAPVTVRIVR